MAKSEKAREIKIPKYKKERNYIRRKNLPDARTWFRFRSKITTYIKGNTTSIYKDNMKCGYCTTGANKTQEPLEECEFTR